MRGSASANGAPRIGPDGVVATTNIVADLVRTIGGPEVEVEAEAPEVLPHGIETCGIHVDGREVDIWMGTMSKTLSGCGGYIAGCKELVSMLRYFAPGFLYSVGMPAQVAAPSLKILELLQGDDARQRIARLHEVSGYFLKRARALGLDVGDSLGVAVVPVILGSRSEERRVGKECRSRWSPYH